MEVAPGIAMVDTLLGGMEGITAAYVLAGPNPALVETGAQTSAPALLEALRSLGIAADDLAWIVLTHVHLDHAGGAGDLAAAFPRATIVVHPRGARHLVDPARLVAGSAAVYGELMPMYGGLRSIPEDRIVAAEHGFRVPLGGSRELAVVDAPGHARHHMALFDEATGTVFAGDALGVQFAGGGLYPAVPPPEFDLDAAIGTLGRLADLDPETLLIGHYGPVPDPHAAIATAIEQQTTVAEAARSAFGADGPAAVGAAVLEALPLEPTVGDAAALERWRLLRWSENNATGLTAWAERLSRDEPA